MDTRASCELLGMRELESWRLMRCTGSDHARRRWLCACVSACSGLGRGGRWTMGWETASQAARWSIPTVRSRGRTVGATCTCGMCSWSCP
eukprot:357166-Chlamydomonas_euryale.AAC.4